MLLTLQEQINTGCHELLNAPGAINTLRQPMASCATRIISKKAESSWSVLTDAGLYLVQKQTCWGTFQFLPKSLWPISETLLLSQQSALVLLSPWGVSDTLSCVSHNSLSSLAALMRIRSSSSQCRWWLRAGVLQQLDAISVKPSRDSTGKETDPQFRRSGYKYS